MPVVPAVSLQLQADGAEAALLLAATTELALLGPCPLGVERRVLPPRHHGWLFSLPAASLVVLSPGGEVVVVAREPGTPPHTYELGRGECFLAPPGTVLQLHNPSDEARELYLLSAPGRAVELVGKRVAHDDSVVVGRDWDEELAPPTAHAVAAQRAELLRRRKGAAALCAPMPAPAPRGLTYDEAPRDPELCLAAPGATADGPLRALVEGEQCALGELALAAGQHTAAVSHRTVEQLWYVAAGSGELWRTSAGERRLDELRPGTCVHVPPGVPFQLRAGAQGVRLMVVTSPRWPGAHEAAPARGPW